MQNGSGIDLLRDAAVGALAGVAGAFVMSRFQSLLMQAAEQDGSDDEAGDREHGDTQKDGGEQEPATVETAEAISQGLFGHALTRQEKATAGPAVHYAFGATMGAAYGVLAGAAPAVAAGRGTLYGAAVWAGADEVVVPLLGLSRAPWTYPPRTHGYALASHLVYGLVVDALRRVLRRLLRAA